ncbi:MAG TPA: A24 family peptidase [Xanthobacteraceae bacterium]|nr:A24 family peptidase [Xanthobacteraceae bacterium]
MELRASRLLMGDITAVVGATVAVAISLLAVSAPAGWFGAGLAVIMLAIAAMDARHFIIPDTLNAAGLVLGIGYVAVLGAGDWQILVAAGMRATALALVLFAIRVTYRYVRGLDGLGFGDVKLGAVAGLWLGWTALPIAIEIAAVSALAVYALRQHMLRRPLRAASRLPFGAFFAPAIWICWLLEATVLP